MYREENEKLYAVVDELYLKLEEMYIDNISTQIISTGIEDDK